MCGIAGILSAEPVADEWITLLDDAIAPRGPDARGVFRDVDPTGKIHIALVHRRLSIIDLDGGTQPMVLDDDRGRLAVVFNGCLYNHRPLRNELEAMGHAFCTDHSDTEVLLHGWRAWGDDLWARLDGMFAAAIWDREAGRLALGHDWPGEKPLHTMSILGTGFVFASVPDAIRRLHEQASPAWLRRRAGASKATMKTWLHQGYGPEAPLPVATGGESTDVQDRFESPTIAVPAMRVEREAPPSHDAGPPLDVDRVDRLLDEAVRSRLEADVPLGAFLSGGVDSSLVCHYASRAIDGLRTFSMRMPDARYDESPHARRVARHLGTDHRTLECEADPASDLVHLVRSTDLPLGDSSLLPTYWISRAAREHVKVVLTGDGGDELFGGYHRHIVDRLPRWLPAILGLVPSWALCRRTPRSRSERLARLKACRFDPALLRAIFEPEDLRRLIGEGPDPAPVDRPDPLTDDFETYLPQDLFRKVDVASMAVGLEARTPFMSRDLVRACLGAPLDVLMPGGERKGLLRALARRHLPADVVDRPKMGFAIPVGEWFRTDHGGMRTLLHDMLGSVEPFRRVPLPIDMDDVKRLLREHDEAGTSSLFPWTGRDHAQRLYVLLVLAIWSANGGSDAAA